MPLPAWLPDVCVCVCVCVCDAQIHSTNAQTARSNIHYSSYKLCVCVCVCAHACLFVWQGGGISWRNTGVVQQGQTSFSSLVMPVLAAVLPVDPMSVCVAVTQVHFM